MGAGVEVGAGVGVSRGGLEEGGSSLDSELIEMRLGGSNSPDIVAAAMSPGFKVERVELD